MAKYNITLSQLRVLVFFLTINCILNTIVNDKYYSCMVKVLKVTYKNDDKINKGVILFNSNVIFILNLYEGENKIQFKWKPNLSKKLEKSNYHLVDKLKDKNKAWSKRKSSNDDSFFNIYLTLPLSNEMKLVKSFQKDGIGDAYFIETEVVNNESIINKINVRFIIDNNQCESAISVSNLMKKLLNRNEYF